MMRRFYCLSLLAALVAGCNRTDTPAAGGGTPAAADANTVSMPTEQMLNDLGPVNGIAVNHLLPDTLFIIYGQPKRLLTSPLAKGNEPILEAILAQAGTQIFKPDKIERLIIAVANPAQVPITASDPQKPEAVPKTQIIPIARRVSIYRFEAPITPPMILAPFIGSAANDENKINSLKHTEGTAEYYDVTPLDLGSPQKAAVGLIDDHTAVVVEGQSEDIRSVFLGTAKKSAAAQRFQHTVLADSEITLLTSLEGTSVNARTIDQILTQFAVLPENVVKAVSENLRALSFSLNISAEAGKPIVSMRGEGKSEDGAKAIHSALQGWLIDAQTTFAAMDDEAKKTFWMPQELAEKLLASLLLNVDKTVVTAALNNFDTLVPNVTAALTARQQAAQQAQIQQQRIQ
ncbi:MAG: hypothetical protein LBT89_07280, partial [Planctomycetaceae bacterium]|nr:hypothetical protein [Planctomycetaceae bacterium]